MEIRPATSHDSDSIARIYGECFPEHNRSHKEWIDELQDNALRSTADFLVTEEDGRIKGAMLIIPHRTFIGGAEFRSGGIAGVAVLNEFRNRRIAEKMIRFALDSMSRRDITLSMLFPSKKSYYDTFGFELAGEAHFYSFPPSALPDERIAGTITPATEDDLDLIAAFYQRQAPRHTLMLARSADVWKYLFRFQAASGRIFFSYSANNRIEGYCIVSPGEETEIRELIAESPGALRALLQFVKNEFSNSRRILFRQPRDLPLHLLWKDSPHYGMDNYFGFFPQSGYIGLGYMARIIDAEELLTNRKFRNGKMTISIGLTDPLIEKNNKVFTIEINGDAHRVSTSDRQPDVALDIQRFTQLLTGYLTFSSAQKLGFLSTTLQTEKIDDIFTIPPPSCLDFF